MEYERIIDLEEVGVADCFELLLTHYRYCFSGKWGVELLDVYKNLVARINCEEWEEATLTIISWGVWKNEHHYELEWNFNNLIKSKKCLGK